MNAHSVVRARIDAQMKEQAIHTLNQMGLSVSDAIRLLLHRVVLEQAFPFEVKIPNASTRKAIEELRAGKGKRFKSPEALFEDLGL